MSTILDVLRQRTRDFPTLAGHKTLERQALFHDILTNSMWLLLLAWCFSFPFSPNPTNTTLFYGSLLVLVSVLRVINQRGNTTASATFFVSVVFVLMLFVTWFDGGLLSPSFPFFVVLLAFGVLMFRLTVAVLFCAVVILYGMLLLWEFQSGTLNPALFSGSRGNLVLSFGVQWLALIGLVGLYLREQRRAYQLLQRKSDELQQTRLQAVQAQELLQAMPASVVMIGEEDTIQFANQATLQMLGRDEGELLGQPWREILLPPNSRGWSFSPRSEGGKGQIQRELEYLHKDGTGIPVLFSMLRQEDTGQWVCYARNLLLRKQVEEELNSARDQAERASKSKSNFLALMSHELRTPLNVVVGYTDMQRELTQDSHPEQKQRLTTILEASEQLLSLINKTLDLSGIAAGRSELVYDQFLLLGLLEPVLSQARLLQEEQGNQFSYSILSGKTWFYGDPAKIRKILVSLLANAFQATERGEVSLVIQDETRNDEEGVSFSVSDNGRELLPEELNNVFSQFFQSDLTDYRILRETSVDLFLCQKLARRMGGCLEVESRPGEGTTFCLWLPEESSELY